MDNEEVDTGYTISFTESLLATAFARIQTKATKTMSTSSVSVHKEIRKKVFENNYKSNWQLKRLCLNAQ